MEPNSINLQDTPLKREVDTYLSTYSKYPLHYCNRLHYRLEGNKLIPAKAETIMYLIGQIHKHYDPKKGSVTNQFKEEFKKINSYYHHPIRADNFKSHNRFSRTPRPGIALKNRLYLTLYLEQVCKEKCNYFLQKEINQKDRGNNDGGNEAFDGKAMKFEYIDIDNL